MQAFLQILSIAVLADYNYSRVMLLPCSNRSLIYLFLL